MLSRADFLLRGYRLDTFPAEYGKQSAILTRDMPEPETIFDAEFDAQLRGLFAQAQKAIETRSAAAGSAGTAAPAEVDSTPVDPTTQTAASPVPAPAAPAPTTAEAAPSRANQLSLVQLLKPLALGLEAVSRATGENTSVLKRLEGAAEEASKAREELPAVVADLRAMLDARSAISQNMFAALHEELKGYKDGFLLDSVHRPIIRDLISLYDDVSEIHRQVSDAVAESLTAGLGAGCGGLIDRLRTIEVNIEHNLGFITEVLNRLEVTLMPQHEGKLDKHTQRAIAVELADSPDEDATIVRTVKRGFMWKDRVFRAEEVVIRKYKEGFLVALAPTEPKNVGSSASQGT